MPRSFGSLQHLLTSLPIATGIKKHYESEFKFLMVHGLKIYDEEDRAEGTQIARAFMSEED